MGKDIPDFFCLCRGFVVCALLIETIKNSSKLCYLLAGALSAL
jgi:hypothetical protein